MEDLQKVVADLKELGDKVDITYITYVAFCGLLSKKNVVPMYLHKSNYCRFRSYKLKKIEIG